MKSGPISGFFEFVSKLNPTTDILCPLLGKVIKKTELTSIFPSSIATNKFLTAHPVTDNLKIESPLCVQDPFELNHNVTRNLPEKAVKYFIAFCSEAHHLLENLDSDDRPASGICTLFNIEVTNMNNYFVKIVVCVYLPSLHPKTKPVF